MGLPNTVGLKLQLTRYFDDVWKINLSQQQSTEHGLEATRSRRAPIFLMSVCFALHFHPVYDGMLLHIPAERMTALSLLVTNRIGCEMFERL